MQEAAAIMSKWTVNEERVDVPYKYERKFVCIEYPGRVQRYDKALETLGGNETVSKIYSNPVKRLTLNWRPEDLYCKPVYGDRVAVTNLLMKVKKRKRKSDGKVEYAIEIIGSVELSYKFQGMCDFQYMPIKMLPQGTYADISDQIIIRSLNNRQDYFSQDVPLFIPPLAFSRVDKPCDFLYRQNIEHRGGYSNPDLSRPPNLIGTVRQRRSLHTIFVNFGEALPEEPIPEAVKKVKADFVDPHGEAIIMKLLEEKPLWLKVEIEHRTGFGGEKLKTFLPALCFYWLDGPWRAQWNKFGYDPTKTIAAKMYQTIDFRIRQGKPGQIEVKAKRTDFRLNQWNTTVRNQKQNVKIDIRSLGEDSRPKSQKAAKTIDKELYYKFKPDKVPPYRMMYYPICYVEIDEVQYLAHQNDGRETVCTERDGWCIKDFHEKAREHMYEYLNRLLQRGDSLEMRFWRSKKGKRKTQLLRLDSDDGGDELDRPEQSRRGAYQQKTTIPDKGDSNETVATVDSNTQLGSGVSGAGDGKNQIENTIPGADAVSGAGEGKNQIENTIPGADESNTEMNSAITDSGVSQVESATSCAGVSNTGMDDAITDAGESNSHIESAVTGAGDSNTEMDDGSNNQPESVIASISDNTEMDDDSNNQPESVIASISDNTEMDDDSNNQPESVIASISDNTGMDDDSNNQSESVIASISDNTEMDDDSNNQPESVIASISDNTEIVSSATDAGDSMNQLDSTIINASDSNAEIDSEIAESGDSNQSVKNATSNAGESSQELIQTLSHAENEPVSHTEGIGEDKLENEAR